MQKAKYQDISLGLDQLYFGPVSNQLSTEDLATTVESFLQSNGWTWDEYLQKLAEEN
jgi:hypothetical protein